MYTKIAFTCQVEIGKMLFKHYSVKHGELSGST